MLKEIPGMQGVMKEARLLPYNVQTYPFAQVLGKMLRCSALEKLHVNEYLKNKDQDDEGKSRVFSFDYNMMLRDRLRKMGDSHPFFKLYHAWVLNEFSPVFGKISYNSRPTFRVHMAGTPSVSAWHTDFEVTGRKDQITVWVPVTNAFESNTIHVESDYGQGDYNPVPVNYGDALLFDGNCLSHGSVSNRTMATRVSFDFRFAPKPEVLQAFFARCKLQTG